MPTPLVPKPSTPLSTTSSVSNQVQGMSSQNGQYTKAQLQNTMEGSRSVKNNKEIEQLLRDYPAALDLYRTGKYKVKVKYEGDVERVILVEKKSNKDNDYYHSQKALGHPYVPEKHFPMVDENGIPQKIAESFKQDNDQNRSRSRTISRDRLVPAAPGPAAPAPAPAPAPALPPAPALVPTMIGPNPVNTTISSIRMASNAQPKVDHHRTPSKDREILVNTNNQIIQAPPAVNLTEQSQTHRRSRSRESANHASRSKPPARRNSRDHGNMIVPFVPNNYPMGPMWNQQRLIQPYYSNPMIPQQTNNVYMRNPYLPPQSHAFPQMYPYGPQNPPTTTYPQASTFPAPASVKLNNKSNKSKFDSSSNYYSSSRSVYNSNYPFAMASSFPTYNHQQQPYQVPGIPPMYQSHMPMSNTMYWGQPHRGPTIPTQPNYYEHRRNSEHRARSMDNDDNIRSAPQPHVVQQPQQQESQQPTAPSVDVNPTQQKHNVQFSQMVPTVELPPDSNSIPKQNLSVPSAMNSTEKLTIRQLNTMFVQNDSSGRLPYNTIPEVLQRFGIVLTENDLVSAAKELNYNVLEPITARRLVHVLVKLGKIARSSNQSHPRAAPSPTMLPEDREVTDILTQRQVRQTGYYMSGYPNTWY